MELNKIQALLKGRADGLVILVQKGSQVGEIRLGKTFRFYDLASLTKIVFTVPNVMRFVERGSISLDEPLARYLNWFSQERVLVRNLLTHTSGLPAWVNLSKSLKGKSFESRRNALKKHLCLQKVQEVKSALYSDLGFWLLGFLLEEVSGDRLKDLWRKQALDLRLREIFFQVGNRSKFKKSYFAPTESWESGRRRVKRGVVNDGNCEFLGGVAPHAGLFASPKGMAQWMLSMRALYLGRSSFSSAATVREFVGRSPMGDWGLGFMKPSAKNSSCGRYFSQESFGHLGFTGTSYWMDPLQDLGVTLLSARRMKNVKDKDFAKIRHRIHDLLHLDKISLGEIESFGGVVYSSS